MIPTDAQNPRLTREKFARNEELDRGVNGSHDRPSKRAPFTRLLVWLLVVAVLGHTAVIALWVGPDNQIRAEVGAASLRSYAEPWFEQNWEIFAPTPRRVAGTFELRALVTDAETGEQRITEWVELVEGEDAMIRGNPFPPRMSLAVRRLSTRLSAAMREMNDEQRAQIEANYRTTPIEDLRQRLVGNDGENPASAWWVDRYMQFDEMSTEFATYYAHHLWDGEIIEIQYRTSNRYVPTYANRHEQTIDDAEPLVYEYGWRAAAELDEQTIELFGGYVRKAGVEV